MKIEIKKIFLFVFIFTIVSSSTAFAVAPGVPHQFFGTVSVNGAPSSDGTTVVARIGGATVSTTTTSGGKYGYSPAIFYVEDPNSNRAGNLIQFFVNGVDSGSIAYYVNGKSTELNLAATIATPPPNSPSGGGSGGGSSSTITQATNTAVNNVPQVNSPSNGPCTEHWTCSEWSTCAGGLQKRTCKDANKCGTIDDLPMITQPCSLEEAQTASDQHTESSSSTLGGITGRFLSFASGNGTAIIGFLTIVALAGYYFMNKKSGTSKKKNYYR